MAGPWEEYQAAAPAADGPWAEYQSESSTAGPWEEYQANKSLGDPAPAEDDGILASAGNIVRGAGERATDLAGGFMRVLGNLPSPDQYIADLMYGDKKPENLPTKEDVTATANEMAKKLESVDLGYKQGTSWEDFKASPIKKFIPFALEQGLVSTPDMVAAIGNLPAYIAARTGEMGQERAKNNNLDNATVEDLLTVLPASIVSSMMERIGAKGILSETAVTAAKELPKAVGKAALKEGLTEGAQEGVEYAATNVGTDAGFDPKVAAERMAAGAVGGVGFGGMARAAGASVEVAKGEHVAGESTASEPAAPAATEQQASPPNSDSADVLYGPDPGLAEPETLAQQQAAERMAPVDPERLDSPRLTPEDRSSPLPNDLIDDGKAIIDGATGEKPQGPPQVSEAADVGNDAQTQPEAAPAPSVVETAVTFDDIPSVEQPAASAAPSAPPSALEASTVTAPEAVSTQPVAPAAPAPVAQLASAAPIEAAPAPAAPAPKAPARTTGRVTTDGFPADRTGRIKKPKSLIEFLAERGGIRDQNGDLKAIGLKGGKDSFVGGVGSLVRKGGMTLDHARKLAVEAGYLTDPGAGTNRPSESYVSDLLNAIEEDVRSGRQKFSQADADHTMRWQQEQQARQDADRYGGEEEFRVKAAMDEVMKLTGSKADDPVAMDIATMMAQDGVDFDTAAIEIERRIDQNFGDRGRRARLELPPSLKDIPFFGDENNSAFTARTAEDGQFPGDTEAATDARAVHENRDGRRSAGNSDQGSGAERGTAGSRRAGEGSRPVQADDGRRSPEAHSREVTAEAGADGKPQLVIPGAEKVSQKEQAQRKADAKLKPKAPQQDAGGMFGDDVNSPELFDKPAPKKSSVEGRRIDKEWSEFSKASGTLGVPRSEMPQIKAEHRGAMVNFLNARGIEHREETVRADSLIPTQKEFSRDKVAKAKAFEGGERSILVANDDHILDGHHQWLAKREAGEDIKVIRLDASIRRLMTAVTEFPSSTTEGSDQQTDAKSASDEGPTYDKGAGAQLSEDFTGDLGAIASDLRARLDKLGLKDVALRIASIIEGYADGKKFTADGSYFRGLVEVSLASPDKVSTLNHEAIHALRDLDVFTKSEWSMLSAKSKSDWIDRFGIEKAYAGSSEAVKIEEGVAAAYADWADGRKIGGAFGRLFQRMKDVVASIGNALRGAGFDSVGKIFQRVESGDIGSRDLFRHDAAAAGEKRFQLSRDPADQAEAKEVMQGFVARGQPIDRAIRLPFEVLGGINKDGTWKPAFKVNEKLGSAGRTGMGLGGIIGAGIGGVVGGPVGAGVGGVAGATAGAALLRAKISPNGKFGWLYPVAENARRGLIDRYGLSEEYIAADRGRQTSQRGIMQKAQDILQVLQNASVGPAEAKVLQAVLTGENVTDTEMLKVAAPIRKAIDELGAEAVSLGLISAESFERNRGAYLHRVYQKNEMDQGGVIAWGSKFMAKKRTRIIGDQLKGRGIFWDVPLDKLMVDVPGWLEGSTGVPANGQRFKVLDYVGGKTKDLISGEEKDGATQRRVYLPADQPIPKKFQGSNWMDRGDWEVRGTGKKVTLWRDYTKEERLKMGEVLDARYTIAKTFMLMANDLSTGRFYKNVAENEEWAQIQPPATEWREAADYGRFWNDPNVGWVRVPETTIANSGGKKRYGALSGMFVRAEIWRDLNEVEQMSKPGIWKTVLSQWKVNKTARSPVTHMNNVMSNLMFMDLADVRFQDLAGGIKSFMKGDGEYLAARDAGAFGSDMIAQEIRKDVLQPILDEIAKTGGDGKNPLLARMGMLGTVSDKIWTWAKAADGRMLQAYQMEDEVFRMATYLRRRSLGDSVETAASHAREQFLDYDIRAPWVNAARNSVLPFISYSYRAIPKVSENVMNRPWKVAKYFAIAYAANMLAYMWDDGDDGEDRERASLRDEEQGYTWFGIPRMMRMPYRDADGMPVFLDVRRWIPSGDVFDTNQGQSAIPVPAPLQLGGPLLMAFEFALNKQSFTGNEITNDLTDTAGDKADKVSDWLWKSWMPSAAWVPNSWYWEKIENAIKGAEDYSGRKYSLREAALSSIGIKLKPQNVEDGLGWKQRAFKEVERALRSEARRLSNKRERGLISDAEFNRGMAALTEKFTNLGKKAEELGQQAKKKPKG